RRVRRRPDGTTPSCLASRPIISRRRGGRGRGNPRMVRRHRPISRWGAALLGLAVVLGQTGCVKRRYTIRTDPPGATVIVNNEEIGRTPVSRSFTFYGDREITMIMDGYKTQRVIQPIKSPWYDNYLTEVFTENFLP